MINTLLFASSALIWGSTWLAIKFQLGGTDPLISIILRFTLAAGLLLLYAALRKKNLRYRIKDHFYLVPGRFLRPALHCHREPADREKDCWPEAKTRTRGNPGPLARHAGRQYFPISGGRARISHSKAPEPRCPLGNGLHSTQRGLLTHNYTLRESMAGGFIAIDVNWP